MQNLNAGQVRVALTCEVSSNLCRTLAAPRPGQAMGLLPGIATRGRVMFDRIHIGQSIGSLQGPQARVGSVNSQGSPGLLFVLLFVCSCLFSDATLVKLCLPVSPLAWSP